MGVDLVGIIGHSLTKKEIIELPKKIDKWYDVNEFFSSYKKRPLRKAKWDGIINEEELELIWQYFESNDFSKELLKKMENFDSVIDCSFGTLSIYRRTILITHWNHKYSNLRYPESAKNILTLNRIIARHFNMEEILYCPDSGFPTQTIQDKALSGLSFKKLKEYGINKFRLPPKHINEARKYMFFIDNINSEFGEIDVWEGESPYWKYNYKLNKYELKII